MKKLLKLYCRIFGHKLADFKHGKVTTLYTSCPRCKSEFEN